MISSFGTLIITLVYVSVTQRRAEGYLMETTVPEDGVYLITMQVDPTDRAELRLRINDREAYIVAYGQNQNIAGNSVALPLKKRDRVQAYTTGHLEKQGQTTMGVAFVSSDNRHFKSYMSGPVNIYYASNVPFNKFINNNGRWDNLATTTTINIDNSGMHWVMARPDCGWNPVNVDIGPGLFQVVCNRDQPILTSGAFYLQRNTEVKMKVIYGRVLDGGTCMSIVYLPYNNRLGSVSFENVAFTAWAKTTTYYPNLARIAFDGVVKTNYSNLYNDQERSWLIPYTGQYVIGICGEPVGWDSLRIRVYKNKQWVFTSYSQHGTKSGQDGVFIFQKADVITLLADYTGSVTPGTMMSIALLKRHE